MYKILLLLVIILVFLIFIKKNNIEGYSVETDLDYKRATKEALEKFCKKRGYVWVQGGREFDFDCKHTKETCLRDSVYPTNGNGIYYEWRDYGSEDAKNAGYLGVRDDSDYSKKLSAIYELSSDTKDADMINNREVGGVCIMGNEEFRKFCEKENLRYDPTNGQCYTTKEYCKSKMLNFCNGDCFEDPISQGWKGVLGDTLGTYVSMATGAGAISYGITSASCNKD
jgi:hypothetical protein